jgi:hypothetical protein
MSRGYTIKQGAMALSIIGGFNTFGRIFCGAVADLPQVRPLPMFVAAVGTAGVLTCLAPLLTSSIFMMLPFFVCYGLGLGE